MRPWRAVALVVGLLAVALVVAVILAALLLYAMIRIGEAAHRAVTDRQRSTDSLSWVEAVELDDELPPLAVQLPHHEARHARCRRLL